MGADAAFDPVVVKAILKTLILPPTGPLLVTIVGLGLLSWRPRVGRALAWTGVIALLVLALPIVPATLHRAYDDSPVFDPRAPSKAQAIVILGSGVRRHAREYGGDTLGTFTLERVRYGARIARATGLPVMVVGGTLRSGPTEAQLMRDALEHEFGVPVRWTEARSRNTHENAVNTAAILLPAGVKEVVLVAQSVDMPRARAEFAAAGLRTVPAPIALAGRDEDLAWELLPGISGLAASYRLLYEMAGELVRRIVSSVR
jgi:uncharacterized SAM-binding protein YcdF (DUF218 family)